MTEVLTMHSLTEALRTELRRELKPLIQEIDCNGLFPEAYLRDLGAAGGFGVSVPNEFGGLGLGLAEQIEIAMSIGAECGSTAFIIWCQTACAWYLQKTPNRALRDRYLPAVARGELFAGSGLSNPVKHLDGIERIHLKATRERNGYRVNGALPWVSNLGDEHLLLTVAEVEGRGYVMFAVPCNAPGLSLFPCPAFAGMEGSRTLNPQFHDVVIDDAEVLAQPHQFDAYLRAIKPGFLLLQLGMVLGVAAGAVQGLRGFNRLHADTNAFLDDHEADLQAELQTLVRRTARVAAAADSDAVSLLDVLRLRADASEFGLRAANAAVLHAGAQGYLLRSPVQRRLREAVFGAIISPSLKHLRKVIHDLETAEEPRAQFA